MLNKIIPVEYLVILLGIISLFFVLTKAPLRIDAITPPPATLNDYWAGNAQWKPYANLGYSYRNATQIKVVNGVWYVFFRGESHVNPACDSWLSVSLDTWVAKSTDQGKTWSAPQQVVKNQTGTAWECAVTDGDAYYDATQNKWHLLAQCGGTDRIWKGCHFTKDGSDPMGSFTSDPANPVLGNRDLWSSICASPNSKCNQLAHGNNVNDAGTYDIFKKENGYYYVGFHGAFGEDGKAKGFRSVAKTQDFMHWVTAQGDVPNDSIFDQTTSATWHEDWQGYNGAGGAGNILYDNGYYYLFVEAAGMGINCQTNQHWDAGILRSSTLANTNWEQLPAGNPVVYSYRAQGANTPGCPLQYIGLFKDDVTGKIYMHYSMQNDDPGVRGVYVSELDFKVPQSNVIQQVSLNVNSVTPIDALVTPTPVSNVQPMMSTPTPTPVSGQTGSVPITLPLPTVAPSVPNTIGGACRDDCFSDDLRTNVGNNPNLGRCDSGYVSISHFCTQANVGSLQSCNGGIYSCIQSGASYYWNPTGR